MRTSNDAKHGKCDYGPRLVKVSKMAEVGQEEGAPMTKGHGQAEMCVCVRRVGELQTKNCDEALRLGECQPFWASWTSWSACSATCGVSERSRYRPCSGAYTSASIAAIEGSCADPARAAEGLQKRDCPLQRLCPRIAGGWGEWGAFSDCDATCGRGSRRRIRLCNRPPPQGGGVPCQGIDTQQVSVWQDKDSIHSRKY
ncbi:unnamed protein product [Hydatigera taeniaeformis]|uniref:TSP1_spondin domain-containing protein n=1 Tax=Hydatigena taeniaeformis TaxID=6205 RepID=A0A0R3X3L3_HYDTA|nr:unnamed protein product [Hydatigera taeniaeformis]